jgi:hypothetical protein
VLKQYYIILFLIIICLSSYCNTLNDIIDTTFRYDKWDDAKIQLEDYIKDNPTDAYAFSLYSFALENLKLYDLAISACKNAINFETSDEKKGKYYYDLGRYYYIKKTNDVALDMFNKSVNLNRTLAESFYFIGLIDYNNKDIDNGFENWKKYISLSTNEDKKKKIQMVMDMYANNKAEQERLLKEKQLKDLEEAKRLEEEKRKKDEILKKLMEELEGDTNNSKSLDEKKIKNDKTKPDIEDIK